MRASIVAFILIVVIMINQSNATNLYNDDDSQQERDESLAEMKRAVKTGGIPSLNNIS